MTNDELQMTKEQQATNSTFETRISQFASFGIRNSAFGLCRADHFDIRNSAFGLRPVLVGETATG